MSRGTKLGIVILVAILAAVVVYCLVLKTETTIVATLAVVVCRLVLETETIIRVLGIFIPLIAGVYIVRDLPKPKEDRYASKRWITVLGLSLGFTALCLTVRIYQPVEGWVTTLNGGTWWSWVIIAIGILLAVYGTFRGEEDDWRLVTVGMTLAVLVWTLQGWLLVPLGPVVLYSKGNETVSGKSKGTTQFLATFRNGTTLVIPKEQIFVRPGLGKTRPRDMDETQMLKSKWLACPLGTKKEYTDEARVLWTGLSRPVVVGIDSQILINREKLPEWAYEAFRRTNNPNFFSRASSDWLKRITQLEADPDVERSNVKVEKEQNDTPSNSPEDNSVHDQRVLPGV